MKGQLGAKGNKGDVGQKGNPPPGKYIPIGNSRKTYQFL